MRRSNRVPKQPPRGDVSLSVDQAVELVPETLIPTPLAIRLLDVLARPGAFMSMTNGETNQIVVGLQNALNKAFSDVPKLGLQGRLEASQKQ